MIAEIKIPMHPADIQSELKKAGLTQRYIADELAISEVTVSTVISGRVTSKRIASFIAEKINKDIDVIWPGRYQEPVN